MECVPDWNTVAKMTSPFYNTTKLELLITYTTYTTYGPSNQCEPDSRHLESQLRCFCFCAVQWRPAQRGAARRKRTRGAERWRRGAIDAFRGTLPSNICETSSTSASLRFVKLSARMREPSTVPFHWDPRLQQPPKKQPWRLLQNNSECANVLWYCLDGQLCQRKYVLKKNDAVLHFSIPFVKISNSKLLMR